MFDWDRNIALVKPNYISKVSPIFVKQGNLIIGNKNLLMLYLQYLTQIIGTKSIAGKIHGNSCRILHFAELNQTPPLLNVEHVGRIATPKLVQGKCLRYLQTTLILGERGIGLRIYMSYCLKIQMKNKRGFSKTWHFVLS